MTSAFDTCRAFHYAIKDGRLYRFVNRANRDKFATKAGAETVNGTDITPRKYLGERGAIYAGLKSAWKNASPDAQILDESHAWRVRRQGETVKVWKDRVAKKKEFVKN